MTIGHAELVEGRFQMRYNAAMPDLFVENSHLSQSAPAPVIGKPLSLLATLDKDLDGIDGISFVNQDPDEKVMLFLRRAMITNLPWVVLATLGLLLPLLFPFLFNQVASSLTIPTSFIVALMGFYYLLIIGFALYQIVNWFYNISIVSNKKVIDIEYSRITAKDVSTATLDSAEDVTYVQNGFLKTLFNFGNVDILTQSANSKIVFELVPKPADVVATVIDLKQEVTER